MRRTTNLTIFAVAGGVIATLFYRTVNKDIPRQGGEFKLAVAQHYDIISPFFEKMYGPFQHHGMWVYRNDDNRSSQIFTTEDATTNLVEFMVKQCGIEEGMKILDIGSGYGGASFYHATKRKCNVIGITSSPVQVNMARRLQAEQLDVADRVSFEEADAETMDWLHQEEGTFDVVWTTEVVCHLQDKAAFFQNARRMLKPGGKICLLDHFKQRGLSTMLEEKYVKPIELGMLHAGLETMDFYSEMANQNSLKLLLEEDLTQECKKTWEVVTSFRYVMGMFALVFTDATFWKQLYEAPVVVLRSLWFMRTFWGVRRASEEGAFVVGLQVYQSS